MPQTDPLSPPELAARRQRTQDPDVVRLLDQYAVCASALGEARNLLLRLERFLKGKAIL